MPRKRLLNKQRYPNGRIKHTKEVKAREEEETAPAIIRRIINEAKRGAMNPLLGSEIGILCMTKKLTDAHVAAGLALGELVGKFDSYKGLGARHAKSPSYQMGYGLSLRGDPDPADVAKVEERYYGALASMGRYEPFVVDLVVYDRAPVNESERFYVRAGLDMLVDFFGIPT